LVAWLAVVVPCACLFLFRVQCSVFGDVPRVP
jgi:hypothetical protein